MDGRREAGDEQAALGAGKNFAKFGANGAFTWRITAALDVGRILQQREHTFFSVLGESVKIEQAIVGGGGVNFEVAGMNHDSERSMNRQRNTIHQAVRDLMGWMVKGPTLNLSPARISRKSASSSSPCS